MSKPPAFQMYASDFYMDTITWTNEEVGVYLRLLLYEWINKDLPDDPQKLGKIVKISSKKFQKLFPSISHKFIKNGKNNLVNPRLEEERQKQLNYLKSQSESGKRGAEKKRKLGLFPFSDPLTDPTSDPTSDPASEKQALQSSSSIKEIYKEKFGEFDNVFLFPNEHEKLISQFGESGTKEKINALSAYIASKGKKYKSHYATILTWDRKNKPQSQNGQKSCRKCGNENYLSLVGGLCEKCSDIYGN